MEPLGIPAVALNDGPARMLSTRPPVYREQTLCFARTTRNGREMGLRRALGPPRRAQHGAAHQARGLMATTSSCRSHAQPIVWGDTDAGRRPFNLDGTRHRDARSNGTTKSTTSPGKDREIRRQVAMKCAPQLVAAAITLHEDAKIGLLFAVADQIDR